VSRVERRIHAQRDQNQPRHQHGHAQRPEHVLEGRESETGHQRRERRAHGATAVLDAAALLVQQHAAEVGGFGLRLDRRARGTQRHLAAALGAAPAHDRSTVGTVAQRQTALPDVAERDRGQHEHERERPKPPDRDLDRPAPRRGDRRLGRARGQSRAHGLPERERGDPLVRERQRPADTGALETLDQVEVQRGRA
jgi:hypothetical protein